MSELLQDKGVHPHQVNIVGDHGSCSSAALSSPVTKSYYGNDKTHFFKNKNDQRTTIAEARTLRGI
jgi:hypothetical protein